MTQRACNDRRFFKKQRSRATGAPQLWWFSVVVVAMLIWCLPSATIAVGQATDESTLENPLYEREPFDRITLNAKNQSTVIEVFPIDELQTGDPSSLGGRELTIRRIQDPPDVRYRLDVRAIEKYERYQDLLLQQANDAIIKDRLDEAFFLLARLNQIAPDIAGLRAAEEAFYFNDTRNLFRDRRYDEALLSLDQVFQRNPRRRGLDRALQNILSQILISEFAEENFASVRAKLDFARRKYGSIAGRLIQQWETELKKEAEQQLTTARQDFAAGNASQALTALRRAADTWPAIEGIAELRQAILAKHPRLRVGISQAYRPDGRPHSVAMHLNWATRRSAPLVARRVVALEEYTVDGGRYISDLGPMKISDDRTSLELKLVANLTQDGHRIVHRLLQLADMTRNDFSPRWSEYVQELYLDDDTIQIRLKRPTLKPEGLLPRVLQVADESDFALAKFTSRPLPESDTTSYLRRQEPGDAVIRELTETLFREPSDACEALLESRLDVVDRIHPADYDKLADDATVRLVPYRLPTIHGLVFGDRVPLLRNPTFRRGLLYGIDRPTFLRQELGSQKKPIAQLISGFAPLGRSANDPLSYAYSPDIRPRAYDPTLALVLMRLASKTQQAAAQDDDNASSESTDAEASEAESEQGAPEGSEDLGGGSPQDPQALPALTLAYPDSHIAAAACESIASNWRRLGIQVTLRPLEPGQGWPADGAWDVLYIETMVEEPLVDLPELVLGHHILGRHGGLIWHAMRQLQDAPSLEDVRTEFEKIHRLTYDHTPLLPLWQIIEHAAVRQGFQGLNESPISLYEDIDQWRLLP